VKILCCVTARDAGQELLSPDRCEARRNRDIRSPQHQSASRNISSGLSYITWENGFFYFCGVFKQVTDASSWLLKLYIQSFL